MLASSRLVEIMDEAKQCAEVVVVDAPPFLVADASLLAARMDGVLLVVQPGKTPIDTARMTLEQMNRAGANIVGVVMNRIPRNRSYYYGGYRYYSPYYYGKYHYLPKNNNHHSDGNDHSGKNGNGFRGRLSRLWSKEAAPEEVEHRSDKFGPSD
jgi:Mrp family chromosome partitioning ATPase